MKAPFPWFGGKSRAADMIWSRFGDVPNYVEPFAGSLAVLLARPHEPKTETVNDLDCYLSNFWRCVALKPEETAAAANWPVNECDLVARHRWLLEQTDFRDKMRMDAHYCDPQIAGWWVWGLCSWIGSGWCVQKKKLPEQIPHLGNAGRGINRKLPHLGDTGRGDAIAAYFGELSSRLRNVRVACGNWDCILGESVTVKHGTTAVLLDPPYDSAEHSVSYSADSDVSASVRDWAINNGNNPLLRIALCGYEGEHKMPINWECVAWKAAGGYGSQSDGIGRENSNRERIWFSPACIKVSKQQEFFV